MKELLVLIAKSLVDHPHDVQVRQLEVDGSTVMELQVAREDLGKVIGKQGRTARSLRTLLAAAGAKARKRVVLEIVE